MPSPKPICTAVECYCGKHYGPKAKRVTKEQPSPTEGKLIGTGISDRAGAMRRINDLESRNAKLIEALEDLWESLPDKIRESSIPETLYERIEALLKEASRGSR